MTGLRSADPGAGRDRSATWSTDALAALSGPAPHGGLPPPAGLVGTLQDRVARIERVTGRWGRPLTVDWPALLTERARLGGLTAAGRVSCGGATRLLPCADGWVAVSLARPSDLELLPAWLALAGDPSTRPVGPGAGPNGSAEPDEELWAALAGRLRDRPGPALGAAAGLVGLAVGVLGERPDRPGGDVTVRHVGRPVGDPGPPRRVLDLGSLWAGPLCASLLGRCGDEVLRVSSRGRPDAAAPGHTRFHRSLNGDKAHLELDLDTADGRAELAQLVRTADVVVESSRPRALEQLGIVAAAVTAAPTGPRVWVSITGHGRASPRVAFGDDAAVAGGLVVHDDRGPWFCGDAVADPLSGIAAAAAAARCLATGRPGLVEVAMAGVAAAHAGPAPRDGTGR